MQLFLQSNNGNQCGQYCVAMIVGKNPSYVINRSKIYGYTRVYQWKNMLRQWGIKCADRAKTYKGVLPEKAMLRLVYENEKHGHAVVYLKGEVYCPNMGRMDIEPYLSISKTSIKSYLEIYG